LWIFISETKVKFVCDVAPELLTTAGATEEDGGIEK
jgi:hypothetical protein